MAKRKLITTHIDVEVKLDFKELKNKVIAYFFEMSRLSIKSNSNKILVQKSGLCSAREFNLLQDCPEDIIDFKSQDLDGYSLWTKDIKEAVRNRKNEIQYKCKVFISDFVFENREEFDKDNIIVGRIDFDTEYFYEYGSSIPYVKKMYFDFFNGGVTDENYDFEKVINILSKRNDIIWKAKKPINVLGSDNVKYISFYWDPTKKDWERFVKSDCLKKYYPYRYEWILENILQITEAAIKKSFLDKLSDDIYYEILPFK